MSEQNREKEEKLFRAMSGVEEELLHRSEHLLSLLQANPTE